MENTRTWHETVTRAALLAVTSLCVSAATVAEPAKGFVLTAYPDAVGGEHLLSGHYSAALEQIRGAKSGAGSAQVFKTTNTCVAYAMMRRLSAARVACDAAVAAATLDRSHVSGLVSKSRAEEDALVAIAYSNRAIVHSLAREAVSSAEDLAEAHSLAPESEYVARNIAAFKQAPGSAIPVEIGALPQ
jgi:hypothetical protein